MRPSKEEGAGRWKRYASLVELEHTLRKERVWQLYSLTSHQFLVQVFISLLTLGIVFMFFEFFLD